MCQIVTDGSLSYHFDEKYGCRGSYNNCKKKSSKVLSRQVAASVAHKQTRPVASVVC